MTSPPAASTARAALRVVEALCWCGFAFVALQVGLSLALRYAALQPALRLMLLAGVELLVLGGLSLALLFLSSYRPSPAATPPVAPQPQLLSAQHVRHVLLGLALGLALKFPADALRAAIELVFPTPDTELQAQASLLAHETWPQILALLTAIGLLGPIAEEWFYRGALFTFLAAAVKPAGVVLLSSAVFALAHASPRDWLPLLLVALALGLARLRSGVLLVSIAAHVAFNCTALLMLLWDAEVRPASPLWAALVGLGVGGAAWLLRSRWLTHRT